MDVSCQRRKLSFECVVLGVSCTRREVTLVFLVVVIGVCSK